MNLKVICPVCGVTGYWDEFHPNYVSHAWLNGIAPLITEWCWMGWWQRRVLRKMMQCHENMKALVEERRRESKDG